MSTWRYVTSVAGAVLLAVFGVAGSAHAAHLVKIDEQKVDHAPPESSTLPGPSSPCHTDFFSSGRAEVSPQIAFANVFGSVTASGNCDMENDTGTDTIFISFQLAPDPDDSAGPVTLCFQASHSLAVDTSGNGTASASFGGSGGSPPPFTTPSTITHSPGAITVFSAGPTAIVTGTDADSQAGLFTANIGDTLTLDVGTSVHSLLNGTGSANARAEDRLSINVGSCIDHGAPAVSHTGLIVLAGLLGALGVLTVRRRRSATSPCCDS